MDLSKARGYIAEVFSFSLFRILQKPIRRLFLKLLDNDDLEYEIFFRGFGNKQFARSATLESNTSLSINEFSPSLFFANFFHAQAELSTRTSFSFFPEMRFSFRQVLIRSISIGLYRRNFHDGLLNGFSFSFIAKLNDLQQVPQINIAYGKTRYARASGRFGCVIPNLEAKLEYEVRRNDSTYDLNILTSYLTPYVKNPYIRVLYRKMFLHFLNSIFINKDKNLAQLVACKMPKWHYVRSAFTLFFNEDIFGATNIYRKATLRKQSNSFTFSPSAIERKVRWSRNDVNNDLLIGAFQCSDAQILYGRFVVLDGHLLPNETNFIHQIDSLGAWPRPVWSRAGSEFVAVTNFTSSEELLSTDLIFPSNSNWAHFFEEILPQLQVAEKRLKFDRIITTDIFDKSQLQAMQTLSKKPIFLIDKNRRYYGRQFCCTVQDNRRSLAIKHQLQGRNMLDENSMNTIRASARKLIVDPPSNPVHEYIYINRRKGLFRPLINKRRIENLLKQSGFYFVNTEALSFVERVNLFGNAKVVVAESGAGMANCHFCKSNTPVLELRHPGMQQSEEHSSIIMVGVNYYNLVGNKGNLVQRLIYGTDSYKINFYNLESVLHKILAKIAH